MGCERAVVAGIGAGRGRRGAGAGGGELSDHRPAAGPAGGGRRDPRPGARVPGRAVLRERLAHTGEMGGIVTPPLKLLDSRLVRGRRPVGRAGDAVHERLGLHALRAARDRRARAAAHRRRARRRRGALLGLELTNPSGKRRTVTVKVDAHSELMAQYPWGFAGTCRTRATTCPTAARSTAARWCSATPAGCPASRRPLLHGDRRLRPAAAPGGETGPGHYGPSGAGRVCAADSPEPMPSECDDGPFGRGTGGQLRYRVKVRGSGLETLWIAVAGSDNSPGEARDEFARLTAQARAAGSRRKSRRAQGARRAGRASACRATRLLQESIDWGKQNLADLTQTATGRRRPLDQPGQAVDAGGRASPRSPGSAPASPTTRGCSPPTASTRPRQRHARPVRDDRGRTCARCATSPTCSTTGSGVVVHEVVADGSVWFGKDTRTQPGRHDRVRLQHRRDGQVPGRRGAHLALDRRRPRSATRCSTSRGRNLEYVREQLDEDGDGWPEGNGNVERPGMGEEKLDNAVYYIRGLYDYADMARSAGGPRTPTPPRRGPTTCAAASRPPGGWSPRTPYADSLTNPGNVQTNQKHWIGANPMEAELYVDGEACPGSRRSRTARPALATRETDCYSGERPGNRGLFHTGCGGGRRARASSPSSRSAPASRRSARATTAGSAPTSSAATPTRTPRPSSREPATGGTPDEQPGAMPEIFPSLDARPARSASRRTSSAAGPAARCSCRPGATTAPRGRSSTSSSACGPTSATAGSTSSRRCRTASRACRARTSGSAAARPTCSPRTTATATRR